MGRMIFVLSEIGQGVGGIVEMYSGEGDALAGGRDFLPGEGVEGGWNGTCRAWAGLQNYPFAKSVSISLPCGAAEGRSGVSDEF